MILRGRYGLDGPEQSLRDVGERIRLSAERVRQIEQRALGSSRQPPTAASATNRMFAVARVDDRGGRAY